MLRLYVIGPATGIPEDNRPAFVEAAMQLEEAGYGVEVPHDYIATGTPHEEAMSTSINVLTESYDIFSDGVRRLERSFQGVAMLDGWEQSEGARLEKQVAEACGIPCKTVDEWIEAAK